MLALKMRVHYFFEILSIQVITVIVKTGTGKIVKLDVAEVNYAIRLCLTY